MGILYKHGMEFGMWVEVLGHGFGRMVLGMLPLQPAGLIQFYSFSSTVAGSWMWNNLMIYLCGYLHNHYSNLWRRSVSKTKAYQSPHVSRALPPALTALLSSFSWAANTVVGFLFHGHVEAGIKAGTNSVVFKKIAKPAFDFQFWMCYFVPSPLFLLLYWVP